MKINKIVIMTKFYNCYQDIISLKKLFEDKVLQK